MSILVAAPDCLLGVAACLLGPSGCGQNGHGGTSSLQNRLDTEDNTKNLGLHVGKDIFLINVNGTGNEYRGVVTVETRKFTGVPVALTVYADVQNGR